MKAKTQKVSARVTQLVGTAAITKAIDSIKSRGQKYQADVHTAAVSCLAHAEKHGDHTLCERLIEALPGMARKQALRVWFCAFGPFDWVKGDGLIRNKSGRFDVAGAEAEPYWEYTPEAETSVFNLNKSITLLLAKVAKAEKQGIHYADSKINLLRACLEMPDHVPAKAEDNGDHGAPLTTSTKPTTASVLHH